MFNNIGHKIKSFAEKIGAEMATWKATNICEFFIPYFLFRKKWYIISGNDNQGVSL